MRQEFDDFLGVGLGDPRLVEFGCHLVIVLDFSSFWSWGWGYLFGGFVWIGAIPMSEGDVVESGGGGSRVSMSRLVGAALGGHEGVARGITDTRWHVERRCCL